MKSEAPETQSTLEDPPKNPPKPEPTPPPLSSEGLASQELPVRFRTALAFEDTLHTNPKERPLTQEQGIPLVEVNPAHYKVSGEFARGGLGRILKAKDLRLGRQVAIKELLHSSQARERFLQEALITARLQHPSIVPIHEAGVWPSGEPFYSMKLVSGKPLNQIITETESLSARLLLLPKMIAVTEAVAYAHSQQIIHRDLKPQNVLIGEFGEAIVIDWGLAKDLSIPSREAPAAPSENPSVLPSGPFTLAGSILGTPGYMPPEQARGEPVDERADVYALGAILYHLLAGCAPFSNKNALDLKAELVPLEQREPEVPVELLSIVQRAMKPRAADRYRSASELLEELQRFTSGSLIRSHVYSLRELLGRWLKRYRAPVLVAAVSLAILGLLGAVSLQNILDAKRSADDNLHRAQAALSALEIEKRDNEQITQRLLQEMGRQQLSDGRFLRAAFFLQESLRHAEHLGASPLGLRALLHQAMRPVEALQLTLAHDRRLAAAAFSPDGQRLATSGPGAVTLWDARSGQQLFVLRDEALSGPPLFVLEGKGVLTQARVITLWDVESGKQLRSFGDEHSYLEGFSISADGQRLAMVNAGEIKVYQLSSGEILATLHNEAEVSFQGALFAPDGTLLIYQRDARASLPQDELARWDLVSPRVSGAAPQKDILSFSMSPDGAVVFARSYDDIALLDASTLRALRALPKAASLAVSPDSKLVATISPTEDSVTLWELSSGRSLLTLVGHSGPLTGASFSPDSKTIATAGIDGVIKLWDASSGHLFASLEAHKDKVNATLFSPDGARLLSVSSDQTARLWSAKLQPWSQSLTASIRGLDDVQLSHNSAYVVAKGFSSDDKSADIWRITGEKLTSFEGEPGLFMSLALSPDSSRLVLTRSNQELSVYDFSGKRLFALVGHEASVDSARFSSDGKRILTAARDRTARVWDAETGALLLTMTVEARFVLRAIFSHDDQVIATAELGGNITLWNANTGALLLTLRGQESTGTSLEFSLDDGKLLSRSADDKAHLWDARTGQHLATFTSSGGVTCALFSPSQTQIVTADREGTVRLWDINSARPRAALQAHAAAIIAMELSHDGERLLTTSTDKTVKLWAKRTADAQSYEMIMTLEGAISKATFSPDDTLIATAGEDGAVKLWPIIFEERSSPLLQQVLDGRAPWAWEGGELRPKLNQ